MINVGGHVPLIYNWCDAYVYESVPLSSETLCLCVSFVLDQGRGSVDCPDCQSSLLSVCEQRRCLFKHKLMLNEVIFSGSGHSDPFRPVFIHTQKPNGSSVNGTFMSITAGVQKNKRLLLLWYFRKRNGCSFLGWFQFPLFLILFWKVRNTPHQQCLPHF